MVLETKVHREGRGQEAGSGGSTLLLHFAADNGRAAGYSEERKNKSRSQRDNLGL